MKVITVCFLLWVIWYYTTVQQEGQKVKGKLGKADTLVLLKLMKFI